MMARHALGGPALVALVVAVALAMPMVAGGYGLYLLSTICAYGVAALGLNLLMGSAGLVSLGHAGFFAIGAYATTVAVEVYRLPYEAGLVAAIAISAAVGALVGFPAVRLKGLYLAIATLAFGICVERLLYQMKDITGGPYGLSVTPPRLFGFDFDNEVRLYYLCLGAALAGALVLANIMSRRPGRMIMALRDNEIAATSFGIPAVRVKVTIFALSAVYAAIGGALYAALVSFVSTEHFTVWLSISFVAMVVVGGLGSIAGSFLGAAFVVLMPEVLRGAGEYQQLVYGLSMITVFIAWPTGLMGGLLALRHLAARTFPSIPKPVLARPPP
jgi:branched-chain amino acid transport system permease protein